MTLKMKDLYFGPPPPVTELTVEQDLKMRVIKDRLEKVYDEEKEHIITLFLALQKQNFVLGNSLTNLVEQWSTIEEVALKCGLLLEIRD